jgi:hypothetical protein
MFFMLNPGAVNTSCDDRSSGAAAREPRKAAAALTSTLPQADRKRSAARIALSGLVDRTFAWGSGSKGCARSRAV